MDVTTAIELESEFTMEQILQDAGPDAKAPYRLTPLDFVSREEWIATQLWKYNVNILRGLHLIRQRSKIRPVERFSSFSFPRLPRGASLVVLILTLVYGAIFMAAWNFEFPSTAERLIWRMCSSMTMGLTLMVGIVELSFYWLTEKQSGSSKTPAEMTTLPLPISGRQLTSRKSKRFSTRRFNNSPDKDPALDVPLKSMFLTQPICAIYTLCRLYVLLEDIIGLRALPATVFQSVDWTNYLPHF
jgi:hypothetical protein